MIDCAEELRIYGRMPDAMQLPPCDLMEAYWRYSRVRDAMLVRKAVATRSAANGDADDWDDFLDGHEPMTEEIEATSGERVQQSSGSRKLTLKEMAELAKNAD